jgi:26S proteasome regulatory subunit N1
MTAPSMESSTGSSSGSWLFKNKEHGKASAAASLGLIVLWDVDGGLALVDKYLYSNDNHVVAGALLAVGIMNCGVHNECDPVCPYSYPAEFYSILHLVCFFNMLFL